MISRALLHESEMLLKSDWVSGPSRSEDRTLYRSRRSNLLATNFISPSACRISFASLRCDFVFLAMNSTARKANVAARPGTNVSLEAELASARIASAE